MFAHVQQQRCFRTSPTAAVNRQHLHDCGQTGKKPSFLQLTTRGVGGEVQHLSTKQYLEREWQSSTACLTWVPEGAAAELFKSGTDGASLRFNIRFCRVIGFSNVINWLAVSWCCWFFFYRAGLFKQWLAGHMWPKHNLRAAQSKVTWGTWRWKRTRQNHVLEQNFLQ